MTDFIKLQKFIAGVLLSEPWFEHVNIITRDWLNSDDAIAQLPDQTLPNELLCFLTPRVAVDGRRGCGVIVEIPEFQVSRPNLSGPQADLLITLLILEERTLNLSPTEGTLKVADQVAQKIHDVLHNLAIHPLGHLYADANAMTPANDFAPLRAFRVRLRMTNARTQTNRVATPAISEEAGTVTLTCATADSRIFYTKDASFPGVSNPAATEYSAPFTVTAGDEIYFAAYAADYVQSAVQHATIS